MFGSALMIEAMKANELPKKKGKRELTKEELQQNRIALMNNPDYFWQVKKDGVWSMFEKDNEGNCYMFGRGKSKETGLLTEVGGCVPHIMEYLNAVCPNGTIIIGELYYPNGTSNDATSITNCNPYKAQVRQGIIRDSSKEYKEAMKGFESKGLIHFYMFDILRYDKTMLSHKGAIKRYLSLETLYSTIWCLGNKDVLDIEYLELAETYYEMNEEIYDTVFGRGEEGFVAKLKTAPYTAGKRPQGVQIKFKIEDSKDVVITGFKRAEMEYKGKDIENHEYWYDIIDCERLSIGKHIGYMEEWNLLEGTERYVPVTKYWYNNWIGSIEFGAYNSEGEIEVLGTCSGFNEALRKDMTEFPESYIGMLFSIKTMQVHDTGGLRHGVFKEFRPDLSDEDCTVEKFYS